MNAISVTNGNNVKPTKFEDVFVKYLNEANDISIAKVELSGENKRCKNTQSDMYYYVLDGDGEFKSDNKEFPVKSGDLVYIPKNTFYQDVGNLKMLSIAVPKFNPKDVVFE